MRKPKTYDELGPYIQARLPWDLNSMSASYHGEEGVAYGLNGGWNTYLTPQKGTRYVIYSYATPIAWIDDVGLVVMPHNSHSNTTGKHQNHVRRWLRDDPLRPGEVALRALRLETYERQHEEFHKAQEEARKERARESRKRSYWTDERIAAKRERDAAREQREALKEVTRSLRASGARSLGTSSLTRQGAIESILRDARVTGVTRDASNDHVTHVRHAS